MFIRRGVSTNSKYTWLPFDIYVHVIHDRLHPKSFYDRSEESTGILVASIPSPYVKSIVELVLTPIFRALQASQYPHLYALLDFYLENETLT